MPRFSILMPTHNRADVIGFAIRSVMAQTEGDFELLIVGDGCTDGTGDIVASFDDPRIRWFDLPKGPGFGYANRNLALRQAKGDLIAFAAHDDLYLPDHLERLGDAIDEQRADWIYSRPLWVSTDGVVIPYAVNLTLDDERRLFLEGMKTIPANCVVHRRNCFVRFGYWPEDVPDSADWHLWSRIIRNGKLAYEPTPTTLHFSAKWRHARDASQVPVRAMLELADRSGWWPRSLKAVVPEGETEQSVYYRLLIDGELAACAQLRRGVDLVIGRLAWEAIASITGDSIRRSQVGTR